VRRILGLVVFLVLISAILLGSHLYLAQRLVFDPDLPDPWRTAALVGIAVLGVSILLEPISQRFVGPPWSRLLAWPASLWMGVWFLFMITLGASDGLGWLVRSASAATSGAAGDPASGAVARAAVVAFLVLTAGAVALRSGLRPPRVRRVEIVLPRWPRALDGFRIVQISDLHVGPILGRRFAEDVASRVNALAPDLVAVTGDLVDGLVEHVAHDVEPLGGLKARHGVFFVTGNHDHYSGADAWAEHGRRIGWRVLRNERSEIRVGDAVFDLVGVDDHRGDWLADDGEDLDRALAGRDDGRPAVLLAHDPTTFKRASDRGIDLQISGHTHGGQIWPFAYLVRLAIPFVAGLYRKNGAHLYVSRGTGFWGPPMRLAAPAEIGELILRSET
jgi:predicted MPP superfamily phosphohydrolase